MGGCCCCFSSRRSEPIRAPTYYYDTRASEERQPLSVTSTRLVVDTNLDASIPDTYTPPPPPIPYNVDLGRHSPRLCAKNDLATDTTNATGSMAEPNSIVLLESPTKYLKDIESGTQSVLEDLDDDLKKPCESFVTAIEEEDCPICLEEYSEENPKMMTECEHHFHLCCILEWLERSDNCPVCDKVVNIDEALSG